MKRLSKFEIALALTLTATPALAEPVSALITWAVGSTIGAVAFRVAVFVATSIYSAASARRKARRAEAAAKAAFNASLQDRTVTALRALPAWRTIYGRCVTGGDIRAIFTTDKLGVRDDTTTYTKPDAYKHLVITFADHEVQALHEVFIDGVAIGLASADGSGWVTTGEFVTGNPVTGFREIKLAPGGVSVQPQPVTVLSCTNDDTSVYSRGGDDGDTSIIYSASYTLTAGDTTITNTSGANVTVAFSIVSSQAAVRVSYKLGAAGQVVDSYLNGLIPSLWTSDHVLSGHAYAVVTLDLENQRFQGGPPNITFDVSGKKLYDPRTTLTTYSMNPALCVRDFLIGKYGFGVAATDIDDTYCIAAANACETLIDGTTHAAARVIPDATTNVLSFSVTSGLQFFGLVWLNTGDGVRFTTTGALPAPLATATTYYVIRASFMSIKVATSRANAIAGTAIDITTVGTGVHSAQIYNYRKYECNGAFTTDDDKEVVLSELAGAMCGEVHYGAKWLMLAGAWTATVMDLTDNDLQGQISIPQADTEVSDLFNSVRATYIPTGTSVVAEIDPYKNATFVTEDGAELWEDIALRFTSDKLRARNIARIRTEQNRNGQVIRYPAKLKAWPLQIGDRVRVTSAEYGLALKEYRVTDWQFGVESAVELTLQEDASTIYDELDAAVADPTPNTDLPNPWVVPALTGVAAVSQITDQSVGSFTLRLKVSWAASTAAYMDGGRIVVSWRTLYEDAPGVWQVQEVPGDSLSAFINNVKAGSRVFIEVQAINSMSVRSAPVNITHDVAATAIAAGGVFVYLQTAAPTGVTLGDIWYDTDDNNKPYRYDGATWVSVRDLNIVAAQTAADNAQTAANTANTAIANIASDSILSPSEKPAIKLDYDTIIAEQAGIDAQATAYSITTEKTAYDNAVTALTSYLGTLSGWNTIPGSDVAIVGATFRTNFGNVYTTRQALLNKIAAEAGLRAAWGSVTGAGKPADNATKNTVTFSGTAPSSPTSGDLWFDSTNSQWKSYNGSTWVVTSDITATKTAANVAGQGAFATISQITSGNVGSLVANATLEATKLALSIGGSNLLANSSFDVDTDADGVANSWGPLTNGTTGAVTRSLVAPGHFGGKAQRVSAAGLAGSSADYAGVFQDIDVSKMVGMKWKPSAWVRKIAGSGNCTIALTINYLTSAPAYLSSDAGPAAVDTSTLTADVWTRMVHAAGQAACVVPVGAATARVYLFAHSRQGGTGLVTIDWDAAQFELGDVTTAYAPRPDEILPGTITATEIADDAITTPKLVAGSVVASKIATSAITTDKLLVTGKGAALNADPNCSDASAWDGIFSTVTDTSLPAGNTAIESANYTTAFSKPVPLDRLKNYNVRAWLKQHAGTSVCYLSVQFLDVNLANISGGAAGWLSSGSYFYYGVYGSQPSGTWTEYQTGFGPDETAKIPVNAKFVSIGIIFNYEAAPGAGTQRISSLRLVEKAGADLIVDGSILATKMAASLMQSDNVLTRGLTVRDVSGNVILSSGVPLPVANASSLLQNNTSAGGVTHIMRPGGGAGFMGIGVQTGAIKITLPQFKSDTMIRFKVSIYQYDTEAALTYEVGGYLYNGGTGWLNQFATVQGKPSRVRAVRFGDDGSKSCLWIGELASEWLYAVVQVSDVVVSWTVADLASWEMGWAVSLATSFGTVAGTIATPTPGGAFSGLDQITSGNVSTYIANASIGTAQIGTLNASVIEAGTITTDRISVGQVSVAAASAATFSSTAKTSATSITSTDTVISGGFTTTGAAVTVSGSISIGVGNSITNDQSMLSTVTHCYVEAAIYIDGVFKRAPGGYYPTHPVPDSSPANGRKLLVTIPIDWREVLSAANHAFTVVTTVTFYNSTGANISSPALLTVSGMCIAQENKV